MGSGSPQPGVLRWRLVLGVELSDGSAREELVAHTDDSQSSSRWRLRAVAGTRINDIAQLRRVKSAADNLEAMVRRGKQLRLRVALVELLPWNNGYPGADIRIRRLNKRIRQVGSEQQVPVFPWYRQLEDPRRPGRMRQDWTIDGDHPSVAGYQRLAAVVRLP